ncbi:MAG: ABC transporter permease [Candidatus Margulisbacteria bacterium]|nr:ABC transporter permease [Candidatus Margulisiibacteriota bacterium]
MIFLAFRQLVSRKRQTLLTLAGIILGTIAFIVISGIMLGFREFFIDQLVNNDAQVHITSKETIIDTPALSTFFFPKIEHVFWNTPPSTRKDHARIIYPAGWYKRLDNDPRIAAYSPQLKTQIILTHYGKAISGQLIGVVPSRQQHVTTIRNYVHGGKFTDIGAGSNRIILGQELLEKLGAHVTERIWISNGRSAPIPFKIVGSFQTGVSALDANTVFGSLSDAQHLNQTPGYVNEIAVRLKHIDQAKQVSEDWQKFGDEKVQSWDQANASFFNIFKIQDAIRYMMITCILMVAGFGIYNILNMVVTQKRKEIAILRSIGFEAKDIIFLFFIQGVVLGILGGLIGVLVGYGLCLYLSQVPFGGGPLGKGTGTLTVSFQPAIYIRAFTLSFIASIIASVLPARAAGYMTPIDIIRSES